MTKTTGEAGVNYYFSGVKASTVVNVQFCDGTKNKYAGDRTVSPGDIFVVGPGCKSSYAIGTVLDTADKPGKTGHLAPSVMTFKKDPGKSDIKKCFDEIKTVATMKDIQAFHPYGYPGETFDSVEELVISDIIICNILRALSVLTYPKLASDRMIDEAKQYLSAEKSMPEEMFGSDMNEEFGDGFVLMGFSGYYPGWMDAFKKLSVWTNDEVIFDENCLTEEDGLLIYEFNGDDTIKSIFKKDKEFKSFFNRNIYLSAFAVMIRGNMDKLLKTALSVRMPISGF